jgi:hypothetical protein
VSYDTNSARRPDSTGEKGVSEKSVNPAPTPTSHYKYQFNGEKLKNNE